MSGRAGSRAGSNDMNFLRRLVLGVGLVALCARPVTVSAQTTNAAPDFKEVYELIRAHLAGANPADLDRGAISGLLNQLHNKVSLVDGPTGVELDLQGSALTKSNLFEGGIAYLRVGRVVSALPGQVGTALKELTAKAGNGTNRLRGVVLDLRFAGGHDYAAAAGVADLFIGKETGLLDFGTGMVSSKAKTEGINLPVTVLVNQQTSAAAEALAAVLRLADRAVILGTNTAGEATMDQIYPLKTGQSLRIATASVRLANGDLLTTAGVSPDIAVAVSAEDEKAYYADPFRDLNKTAGILAAFGGAPAPTNGVAGRPARVRPSEADLIRDRKNHPGREVDYSALTPQAGEVEKPVVRDPVLARALDLLKVISMLPAAKPA